MLVRGGRRGMFWGRWRMIGGLRFCARGLDGLRRGRWSVSVCLLLSFLLL